MDKNLFNSRARGQIKENESCTGAERPNMRAVKQG